MRTFPILLVTTFLAAAPMSAACTFGLLPPSPFAANAKPGDVTTGDFNEDGFVDLAILNRTMSTISILRGNNNGGFNAPTTIATDFSEGDLQAGDFDNDDHIDLVFAVPTGANVSSHLQVLLGNGNGTFDAVPYTADQLVFQNPNRLALGDFDHDGLIDAVVTKDNGKFASMRNVGGKFVQIAESTAYAAGITSGIAVGDFDDDDELDVAVSEWLSQKVYLYFGNGDGTFTAGATPIDVPHATWVPQDVQSGDFNGDFDDDLAIVMFDPSGSTSTFAPLNVALSNGAARTFATPVAYGGLHKSFEALVNDIDGDGNLDVLMTDNAALRLFRGNGDGTFANAQTYGARFSLGLAIDDFDRDGGPDVVTTAFLDGQVDVFLNACGRAPFGPPPGFTAFSTGGPVQLTWSATANTQHYEVWRNTGSGWAFLSDAPSASFTDSTAPSSAALLYRVRAVATEGAMSAFSAHDLALTYTFTDATLQPGITLVKLAHLTELRAAANAVRALASLGAVSWADPSPQKIRAAHITELRTAIDQARAALGLPAMSYTDPTLTVGSTPIRAIHFEELRAAMR